MPSNYNYDSILSISKNICILYERDRLAALELALLLLATVLASSILDQIIPRISLPLIQIALGAVVGFLAREQITITLNPELFLVLFIAPLLFHEAQEANNMSLWKNRTSMLSYAIGLVVAIVLAVGFTVNWMIPSIPLAAAFALGAALGPTDPIAVASISQQADIPERQRTILKGESLLNDASGIVSFQFAIAAVVTGTFSVAEALQEFMVEFFGALAVGIVLGFAIVKFTDKVRDMGLENTTFHVSLELLTPFFAYLLGEALNVSGVILVVACGITMSLMPRDFRPSMSRMNIVSTSVWQVITFALNGVVFVMLGTQLPQMFGDLWIDDGISNVHLIIYILAITALMHSIRFIWSLLSDALSFHTSGEHVSVGERMRSAAITTLSGSKGAITLAIMCSIPIWINTSAGLSEFPQRDLLIFLSCGVILMSLLLATFIVPILAPREKESLEEQRERDAQAKADIFRTVVEELTARQKPENRAAIAQVISQYNNRIERIVNAEDLEDESDVELRIKALNWEEEFVLDLIDQDEVPPEEAYQYLNRLARTETLLSRGHQHRLSLMAWFRRRRVVFRKRWMRFLRRLPGKDPKLDPSVRAIRDIQVQAARHVIERLESGMVESDVPSEKISNLIMEYQHTIRLLRGPIPSMTSFVQDSELDLDATRLGLRLELEQIQLAYEEKRISRAAAQKMRENVYVMQVDLEEYV